MVRNLSPLLQCTGRKELLLVNLACFKHADQHLIWFEETSTASNIKIDQVQENNQLTDDHSEAVERCLRYEQILDLEIIIQLPEMLHQHSSLLHPLW